MSFGFSVGDFVTATQVVYKLFKALSDSTGSSIEYQQVISELDCTHRVFLQLQDLCATNQMSQANINGIGLIVSSSIRLIEPFLHRVEKYRTSLSSRRTANQAVVVWRKIGWSIHKPAELAALKDGLRSNQINLMLLVVTATHHELTIDRFGYNSVIAKKVPAKYDFTGVKIYHTVTASPVGKQQPDPTFVTCKTPERLFMVGQIFAVIDEDDLLQAEAQTPDSRPYYPNSDLVRNHYTGICLMRRFAVVQEGVHGALCVAIHTYDDVGCIFQPDQDLHAIIYSSSNPPKPLQMNIAAYKKGSSFAETTKRDESGMTKKPIRMAVDHVSYSLSSTSRLHFGRIYHVKHDVRVKSLGVIHVDSISHFVDCYKSVHGGFSVPRVIGRVARRLNADDPRKRSMTYKDKETSSDNVLEHIKLQDKARANLEALCMSNQSELVVIARYDSDYNPLDVRRHPNRLRFKRGDKIKVLNAGGSPIDPIILTTQNSLDDSTLSRDTTSPTLTWWLGELDGRQGEFPWWYVEIE